MKQSAFLRQEAFRGLRGRWGTAGVVCLFQVGLWLLLLLMEQAFLTGIVFFEQKKDEIFGMLISPMRVGVSVFFALLSFLLLTPLNFGLQKWFYQLWREPMPDFRIIFDYLQPRQYGKALWLRALVWLRTFFVGALLALPLLAVLWAQQLLGGESVGLTSSGINALERAALLLLAALLAGTALLLTLAFRLRYAAAPYLLAEDPDLSAAAALRLSAQRVSAGRLLAMVLGWLRFLPAVLLIFPIFFLIPYLQFQFAAAWSVRLVRSISICRQEQIKLDLPA